MPSDSENRTFYRGETKMIRFLPVSIWGWLILMMIVVMEKPVVGQQVRRLENAKRFKIKKEVAYYV